MNTLVENDLVINKKKNLNKFIVNCYFLIIKNLCTQFGHLLCLNYLYYKIIFLVFLPWDKKF